MSKEHNIGDICLWTKVREDLSGSKGFYILVMSLGYFINSINNEKQEKVLVLNVLSPTETNLSNGQITNLPTKDGWPVLSDYYKIEVLA